MRRAFFLSVAAVLLISTLACLVETGPRFAPPSMREEVASAQPGTHFVWIPGHWGWRSGEYVWMGGYWVRPRTGHNWVSGHWVQRGHRWKWYSGRWQ